MGRLKSNAITADNKRFESALQQVLKVSKTELQEREKQYQAEREGKPKRGPKPKPSASGHVSGEADENGSSVVDTESFLPVGSF
jgi:hypothetical protein